MVTNASGRLYRILSFDRAVQIFQNKELHFAHPSSWSDPYEIRLTHSNSHQFYGQCWCTKGVSDAMWRIYSANHLGVRISTSTRLLREALEQEATKHGFKLRLQEVDYLSQYQIDTKMKDIRRALAMNFDVERAIDALFLKRSAFDHESEYRVIVYCPNAEKSQKKRGVKLAVNPHKLIDNVLLDPRAPDELVDALTYYFKEKIKFKGTIRRSVLYKSPTPLVIE